MADIGDCRPALLYERSCNTVHRRRFSQADPTLDTAGPMRLGSRSSGSCAPARSALPGGPIDAARARL